VLTSDILEDKPMPRSRRIVCFVLSSVSLALCTPLANSGSKDKQAPARPANQFARIKQDASGQAVAFETAIVRYLPESGQGDLVVDLIGAVHVGDRAYYEKLNKRFEDYDVVLYELVAPPGTRIPKGGRRTGDGVNPIGLLQQIMKTVLDLELQTERIDYTKKNFVHADLSPEGMAEAMRNRGETGLTVILNIVSDLLKQQNLQQLGKAGAPGDDEPDILSMLIDPTGGSKLKRLMAEQLINFSTGEGGLGRTLNTILVTDRNQAAMKVLQSQIGKGRKKIAIFYGIAHLSDFEKRLHDSLGLKRSSEQWLTAWDLRIKNGGLGDLLKLLEP
jgi:hypothetical protein